MDLHTSARDPFADGQDDADEAGVNHRWLGSARAEATSAWAREVARAAARDSHAKPRQRYSVQKPTHKQPKKTGDARFGITVNTHFSTRRRAGTTGRPHGQTQRTSPRTQRPNGGGFVSLADLNALDHQESTPEKRPVWAGDEREAAPVGKGQTGIEAAEREAVSPVKKQGTLGQPAVHTNEQKRRRNEKEDALAKKVGGLWRGRGCFSSKGCLGRGGPEARKRRRLFVGLTVAFVLMIILIIALATTLTRRTVKEARPQSRFLNVTGWPAIPTGVSTVAQPDVLEEDTSCVFPSTMWSCSLPKELHEVVAPSSPNQPNLKVEIKFRNDSAPPSESSKRWDPSPAPPGLEEQQFIGNTTDKVVDSLKEGEETPFYMSILATPSPPNVRLQKRADEFPDITATIPPPDIGSDGTANAANLLPLLDDQPLRLYDRGLATEHYGFYNYFDRSIFLRSVSLLNQSDIKKGEEPADQRGGSTEEEALVRCTWAQTRFLVQIWTQRPDQSLLPNATASATGPTDDFARPGSFPYPITIATDRHGGDVSRKMIYCYGLDHSDGTARVVSNEKKIQVENRGFGGELVGGGQGPLGKDRVTLAEGGMGGIDGGTGGCACRWRNFRGEV
ncbi:MAG: hypothetical protein M1832_001309 [Thelocarpon impressellum]|nr:MAG: hypothetical protein M1832_001309 [Thelocarpon impressellum]